MTRSIMAFGAGFILAAGIFSHQGQKPAASDNPELTKICDDDQADRQGDIKKIDWSVVGKRDAERLKRVKEIYSEGGIHSGMDMFHAALVLQHSNLPDDYLLSHDLCVCAIATGQAPGANWLAAASEDRFLMNIN